MTNSLIILGAVFDLNPATRRYTRCHGHVMNRRREKQPLEWPSAGSAFPNARKGVCRRSHRRMRSQRIPGGGAMVSEKHAGL